MNNYYYTQVPTNLGEFGVFTLPDMRELNLMVSMSSPNLGESTIVHSDQVINLRLQREDRLDLARNKCTKDKRRASTFGTQLYVVHFAIRNTVAGDCSLKLLRQYFDASNLTCIPFIIKPFISNELPDCQESNATATNLAIRLLLDSNIRGSSGEGCEISCSTTSYHFISTHVYIQDRMAGKLSCPFVVTTKLS